MKIVAAFNAGFIGEEATEAIVFIPMGRNTITPSVDGVPKEVTVSVTPETVEAIASAMNNDLKKRLSANVRPTFDFDHKETGPASALPKRFYADKDKGVMVEVEWTGAGKSAIEAKDYSYFSPVFLLGDDGKPQGLPMRGTLGALVNDPAFREIPRIAAANAASDAEHKPKQANMSEALVKCGLLSNAEAAKEDAVVLAANRLEGIKKDLDTAEGKVSALSQEKEALEKQVEDLEGKIKAANEAKADEVVKAAVAEGKIAPKDEDTQNFYRDLIVEKGEVAIKALNAMPNAHKEITEPIVKAGVANPKEDKQEEELHGVALVAAAFSEQNENK